jgi:cation diffusion facilitator CzcD-associated flavoprotein CzcO
MNKKLFQWAVVGAGPAGIAAVGKLIDHGVKPQAILWLDPYFNVGDLGRLWYNVSSNTKVKLFIDFLNDVDAFQYQTAPAVNFELNQLPPDKTCILRYVADPLQWVSDHLCQEVNAFKHCVDRVILTNRVWSLHCQEQTYQARNVILATGALPSKLNYPEIEDIPFELAIDKERLHENLELNKTYAVFGSSHSAIMIIRYLVDLGVKKVINFYRSPCRYAIDLQDWILFDNTGLKGQTAEWARQYIDGQWPENLIRHTSNDVNIAQYLPKCDKAIYAVGFQQRNSIIIGDYEHMHYNPHVGIIGPGLFGIGIAYPEKKLDPLGSMETQVGLWKFMTYLNKILPIWFKYTT